MPRFFLTVGIIYSIHFASNVVRETYLAITLGERLSVRVDEFLGLHPDLFEIPGRGAYINSNPGASMLGAIPYALAHPLIAELLSRKPELARPKGTAAYDDPRPNRRRFMNEARARGLDIKLGLAAVSMHIGLMAPLGALGALAIFLFLRRRLGNERQALWLGLLYAFGTPIFFRSGFLNQNAIIAHCVLFAYILLAGCAAEGRDEPSLLRIAGAGALLGVAILNDYSGIALASAFGAWALIEGWRRRGVLVGLRWVALLVTGAAGPVALLLVYQWMAFGNPWLPAQAYMPATQLSVLGWNGLTFPTADLLIGNLFDPRYGLLAYCPMLAGAAFAPALNRREGGPTRSEIALIFGAAIALYLFSSSVQFATLQFNTGVRYMVPAAPLLFIALVPVLLRMPRWAAFALIIPTLIISWSVSMARESVPVSLAHIFLGGFELPWLSVLRKTSGAYVPFLAEHSSPVPLFLLVGVVIWLIWRGNRRAAA